MIARRLRVLAVSALLLGGACSSSSSQNDGATGAGGPVAGPADDHCANVTPIVVNQASCHPTDTGADAGAAPEEEAPVLYNAEGDDDDCKYHVAFTTTPATVARNQNLTFNVMATVLAPPATNQPATGAAIIIESYMADNQFHVLSSVPPPAAEIPAGSGQYKVTPVKFDMSGRWVVRFHLYEDCSDLSEDSPHGHVAFYVDVP
jgi:hypothetical protein